MFFKRERSNDNPKFYVTTAIDYVNSSPHIGTAYEKIATDVLVRFRKLEGYDVRFQMGNDEHSINVKRSADAAGLSPKAYCDGMEEKFTSVWKSLNINYDGFIRTTDPEHQKSVQKLFQIILDKGDIYKDKYEGWYCESCEAFLTDKDLEDGKCPNHKTTPKWLKEENYFFALSKYQEKLLAHIKKHPEFILPEGRRNEVIKMIEMGLQNISVSRSSFDWGIELPHDPDHVVYVWFDALINYITAVGYGTDEKKFDKWWPAQMHIVGKDIIRFHCVIWPAMLMSAGIPLPKTIFAHGFVYLKGEKMSKSLGNVVTPLDITKTYGEDPLRYYLMREVPFGKDADFTWEHFIERYNGELANGLGNLVSRTLGMIKQYLSGEVPVCATSKETIDNEFKDKILSIPSQTKAALELQDGGIFFNNALAGIWEGITASDRYINDNKPWVLNKDGNVERIKIVLSHVAEAIRILSLLMHSFIPRSAENIWKQFGFDSVSPITNQKFANASEWGFIRSPVKINAVQNLFPRIEDDASKKTQEAKKEEQSVKSSAKETRKDIKMTETENLIDIMDFAKVELKVGQVMQAERIEGADKLLKLQVNIGEEIRQIVAGIAKSYTPEELIGKKIAVVVNLKPAKLRGVESNGMLLAASSGDVVSILTPFKDVPAGAKIK